MHLIILTKLGLKFRRRLDMTIHTRSIHVQEEAFAYAKAWAERHGHKVAEIKFHKDATPEDLAHPLIATVITSMPLPERQKVAA